MTRARGAGKTRITIFLDDDVLAAFRRRAGAGGGYQTLINDALREHVGARGKALDSATLRQVIRAEIVRGRGVDSSPGATVLLREAFAQAARLPKARQDLLAARLLGETLARDGDE